MKEMMPFLSCLEEAESSETFLKLWVTRTDMHVTFDGDDCMLNFSMSQMSSNQKIVFHINTSQLLLPDVDV